MACVGLTWLSHVQNMYVRHLIAVGGSHATMRQSPFDLVQAVGSRFQWPLYHTSGAVELLFKELSTHSFVDSWRFGFELGPWQHRPQMRGARVNKSRGGQQPREISDPRTVLVETVRMPHDSPEVDNANDCSSEGSRQEGSGGSAMSYLWKMQLTREERSQAEACEKYCKVEWDSVLLQ